MTIGDRIRAMTDEELAEFISPLDCKECPVPGAEMCVVNKGTMLCLDVIESWLKQPYKER